MRRLLLSSATASVVLAATCFADLPIDLIQDVPGRIDASNDIVVAQCTKPGKSSKYPISADFVISDFEVLRVLKGTRKKGPLRVAQPGPPKSNIRYLLFNAGGATGDSTFLTGVSAFEKVEVPSRFDLSSLDGKSLKEQVVLLIEARKDAIDRMLKSLRREKLVLERALSEKAPVGELRGF